MSEKQYLNNIADKVSLYVQAKQNAIDFLVKKEIKNRNSIQNCLIMSQIWTASQIDDNITLNDIMIYLGNTESADDDLDMKEVILDDDMKHLTLNEILEVALENDDRI
jgi:hypothetical protein